MFKERLKSLRLEKELTQEDFANKIGYTRAAISAWEIGRNEPSNADTIKIANFFDVSTDYLLGKTEVRDSDEVRFAYHGISTEGLTEEEIKDVERYKEWIKQKKK